MVFKMTKSTSTVSNENKIHQLIYINQKILEILSEGLKGDLSHIDGWELRDMTKKINFWYEKIFPEKSISKNNHIAQNGVVK